MLIRSIQLRFIIFYSLYINTKSGKRDIKIKRIVVVSIQVEYEKEMLIMADTVRNDVEEMKEQVVV